MFECQYENLGGGFHLLSIFFVVIAGMIIDQ